MEIAENAFALVADSLVATESVHVCAGMVCASREGDVNRAKYSSWSVLCPKLVMTCDVCDVPICGDMERSSNPVPLLPVNVPTGSAVDFSPLVGAFGVVMACR